MGRAIELAGWAVKKLWLVLAVVLVLFAVVLSVLRYALPHLDDNKALVEDYISKRYGVELTIGALAADWQRQGPTLVLDNVSLAQNASSPVGLDINKIDVELDFWASLRSGQLASNQFNLNGLTLRLDTTRLGGNDQASRFPVVDALQTLFLEQLQRFSLRDGVVILSSEEGHQIIELTALDWLNQGRDHQGEGLVRVRELASNSASFAINLVGDKNNLTGLVYARAEDLDISPYVSGLLQTHRPLQESRANIELWAQIEKSEFSALFTRLHDSKLVWGGQDSVTVSTAIRGGNIQALPHQQGWNFRVDGLEVVSNDQQLVTDVVGHYDGQQQLIINTIKPAPVNPFLVLLPLFTDDTADDDVRQLNPTGELATLQLQLSEQGAALAAKLINVSWQQTATLPGIDALDMDVVWFHDHGRVNVRANEAHIYSDQTLADDLTLKRLKADAYIYQQAAPGQDTPAHWMLSYQDLIAQTDAFSLTQSLQLNLTDKAMQLAMQVDDMPISQARQLLPTRLMGEQTYAYLKQALVGPGTLTNTRVLWSGQFADFPFSQNQGVFQAFTELQDAEFLFSSQWPALTELDLALQFTNNGLHMVSEQARLDAVTVHSMQASLPTLSPDATLTIDAAGQGNGAQLARLMLQSSLADSLGNLFTNEVVLSGPLNAQLNLAIPLNSPAVVASGTATLDGATVDVRRLGMQLANVSGEVDFRNANIDGQLQADWLAQPLTVALTGGQGQDGYQVDIGAQGDWQLAPLLARVNPEFSRYVEGATPWQANVALALPEQGFNYTASVTSTLQGVSASLPSPLSKDSDSVKRLAVTSRGDQQASAIQAMLGDEVTFEGILPHQEMQFSRAHLALGDSDFSGTGIGFSVSAALPLVNITDWYKVIELLVAGTGKTDTGDKPAKPLFSVPERIFVNTDNLVVAGQSLTDVAITAKYQNRDWLVDLDAKQARARINIYDAFLARGIEIDADYINFADWQATEASPDHQWDPARLPPIYFECDECSVLGKHLGQVTADIRRSEQGMAIRQLRAQTPYSQIDIQGDWLAEQSQTRLTGTVKSQDIGRLLDDFAVNSGIKDSAASIEFDISWPDSPMDFAAGALNGNINWRLTDGYLSELSDQGSRIFTLFSLNSLVRKLSLDFRDVFAKGFFYDDMSGSLQLTQGVASTRDTVIDGGAGEITINGYTDLAAQELNYAVSFTPNVTGNLPVLVYFLASPPTALAALALDQVLTSAKVISNVNYKVTGTWSEPQFTEVGRNSKEVTLPARQTDDDNPPLSEPDLQRLQLEVQDG